MLVPDVNAISTASVDITIRIGVNPIRDAVRAVSKQSPILQGLAICRDIESVNRSRSDEVRYVGQSASVGYIDMLEVRREFDPVGFSETVRHSLYDAGVWFEAVDLEGKIVSKDRSCIRMIARLGTFAEVPRKKNLPAGGSKARDHILPWENLAEKTSDRGLKTVPERITGIVEPKITSKRMLYYIVD